MLPFTSLFAWFISQASSLITQGTLIRRSLYSTPGNGDSIYFFFFPPGATIKRDEEFLKSTTSVLHLVYLLFLFQILKKNHTKLIVRINNPGL